MDVSSQCFDFLQARIENLNHLTECWIFEGLKGWDLQRGCFWFFGSCETCHTGSPFCHRAQKLLMFQISILGVQQRLGERSAASRHWLLLHPSLPCHLHKSNSFSSAQSNKQRLGLTLIWIETVGFLKLPAGWKKDARANRPTNKGFLLPLQIDWSHLL